MKNALIRSLAFWILFDTLLYALGKVAAMIPLEWLRLCYAILGVLDALLLIWIFLRNEKKSFKNIGLSWDKYTLLKFLLGLFIGTVIMTLFIFVLTGFTSLQLKKNSNTIEPLSWIMYLLVIITMKFIPIKKK